MTNKNNGMHLEVLINKSIALFNLQYQAFFKKRYVDIIIKNVDHCFVQGKIKQKSETDYYGFYQGNYFDFEAKQTNKNAFLIKQIQPHQLAHLYLIHKNCGFAFLIISFINHNLYFIITFQQLVNYYQKTKRKSIPLHWFKEHCVALEIIFPGVINFKKMIDDLKLKYYNN
ncbi:Holliday junction resolvase RecU [Ureaplasma urealyticum]|uniref:Holliday junction resolvase RecU n=1 Tax=Ureaplasma urealyticum TaxID=2130 RepID=UPI00017940F0|nr:Holliday junction resolvase RecU [Ureaplasma urealyticum]EEH02369.1 recombination protein U [Ureaplasma urealyticum serovar 2 str. ATCC 27814]MDU3864770.1 Holliday junction resolvase RecU [Ureaplasma urealyticum]